MFENMFKNIDDILHKDAGCGSELDCVKIVDLQKRGRRQISDGKIDSYGSAESRALDNF